MRIVSERRRRSYRARFASTAEPTVKSSSSDMVAILLAASSIAFPAQAQNYPFKTVRMIVPYAPGGIVDYAGRLMAQRLSESFGQNVIVDNRPGAGGVIGVDIASKAGADGYTLVIMDP